MSTALTGPLVKGAPSAEIDGDLIKALDSDLRVTATKQLALVAQPTATASASGPMSAAQAAKLAGVEAGATGDQTAAEIASLLNAAGLSHDVGTAPTKIYDPQTPGEFTGAGAAVPLTVSHDPDSFEILVFEIRPANHVRQLCVAMRHGNGTDWPTAQDLDVGLAISDIPANMARVNVWSTGATNLTVRGGGSSGGWSSNVGCAIDTIWGFVTVDDYLRYGSADNASEAAIDARIATWAQAQNTGVIPGAKLANAGAAVVADAAAADFDAAPYSTDAVIFSLADRHFYRVIEDTTQAVHPMRITFAPDDLAPTIQANHSRGYARQAIPNFTTGAHGTLALAPDVAGTLPTDLLGVIALTSPDGSSGVLLIVTTAAATRRPARLRYTVGNITRDLALTYQQGLKQGVYLSWSSTRFSGSLRSPWGWQPGQTANIVVDFDLLTADGTSYVPLPAARRRIARVDLPGTTTNPDKVDHIGEEFAPYGQHQAPDDFSGLLIDTDQGDEYFTRLVGPTADQFLEPVHVSGTEYGHTHARRAIYDPPDWLHSFTVDHADGVATIEATDDKLDNLSSLVVYDQDWPGGTSQGLPASKFIEVPEGTTDLGTRQKKAFIGRWHSGTAPIRAAEDASGFARYTIGDSYCYYDHTARKIKAVLRDDLGARDSYQRVGLQRVKFSERSNGVWSIDIPILVHNGDKPAVGGQLNPSTLIGEVGGNLHPAWYEISLKLAESGTSDAHPTDQVFEDNSVVDLGYRTTSQEAAWLVIYHPPDDLTDTFYHLPADALTGAINGPPTPGQGAAYKLEYESQVYNHTRNRFRYGFASGAAAYQLFTTANRAGNWYVGIVITGHDHNSIINFTRSLESIPMTHLEVDHVPIGLTITERRMYQSDLASTTESATIETYLESAEYGTAQSRPWVSLDNRYVNFRNARMVRATGLFAEPVIPPTFAALRFNMTGGVNDAPQFAPAASRKFWDLKSRGARFPDVIPTRADPPYRLRRFNGREYRAWAEQTDKHIRAIAGAGTGGMSRTQFRSLGTGTKTSLVLTDIDFGSGDFVRLYFATGEPPFNVDLRVENVTRGWSVEQNNIQPTGRDEYTLGLGLSHHIADGDELLIQFGAPNHSKVTYSHRTTTWREA